MKFSDLVNFDLGELSDWLVSNYEKFYLLEKPVSVNSVLDVKITEKDILVWDGCDWHIDRVILDADGNKVMEEKTPVEAYMPLPSLYLADNPNSLEKLTEMDMGELSEWVIENQFNYILLPAYVEVDTPEDIDPLGEEVLCFSEDKWSIDYADMDSETGGYYMANNSPVEAFVPLPEFLVS